MAFTIKRVRIEPSETLKELKEMFDKRMYALERKMEFLINTCTTILGKCEVHKKEHTNTCCAQLILPKLKVIDNYIRQVQCKDNIKSETGSIAPIVLLPNCNVDSQVIELNSEKDLPTGSWLGDKKDPKARVRVKISPEKLKEIHEFCHTPEKMALTLLDYLFPREVLAVSNLSGKGKHSKKQLDPLLIYAIKCHLSYKFNITEQDWHRIKQNLDSKCRTIWKKNNMSLAMSNNNNQHNYISINNSQNYNNNNKPLFNVTEFNDQEEFEKSNILNGSVSFKKPIESRSNSPLKNITTLPSIMEEDPDINDFIDDDYINLLKPQLILTGAENDCFTLDTKNDPELIPDKLFDDGVLDCHTNLDS